MQNLQENEDQISILQELNIQGLNSNPALDRILHLLILGQRLSKISLLTEKQINEMIEQIANEIYSITTTLTTLKIYEDVDISRLKFCVCVFLDGMLMQNTIFIQSSYVNNTFTQRFFKELSDGKKFFSVMDKWFENPLKNKDMLEVIYVCLLLGYRGHLFDDEKKEEKITLLCENIASSLTPTLNSNDMLAFEYAYKNQEKETFWQKYSNFIIKLLLFVVPPTIIVSIYLFQLGIIKNDIFKTSSTLESQINSYKKNKEEQEKEKLKEAIQPKKEIKKK